MSSPYIKTVGPGVDSGGSEVANASGLEDPV